MNVYPTSVVIWAKISNVWTDISSKVVTDLDAEMGMHDGSYNNRLASPGKLSFQLNNASGEFTPSATFSQGVELRVLVTYAGVTKTKFYGRIFDLDPDVGTWGNQRVKVVVMDWLKSASEQPVRERPVETNKRAGDAVRTLLESAHIKPLETLLDGGTQTFPTVFDAITKNTRIYQELNDLVISEWGYAYLDKGGERFRLEGNDARKNTDELAKLPVDNDGSALLKSDGAYLLKSDGGRILLNRTSQASYNNSFDDLDIVHGRHLLNDVAFTVFPRVVDTTLKVLFTLGEPIFVPELGTIEFTGYFSDPAGGNQISGTNLQNPVITTDYLMFANADGTGTNLSANITLTPSYSADGAKYTVVNSGAAGYITFFNQRGFGIYPYNPIDVVAEDRNSKEVFGPKSLTVRQTYQQSADQATVEANKIVDVEKEPRTVVLRAHFTANASDEKMKSFMHVDISHLVEIQCTKPAIDSNFFVNGHKWKITPSGFITFSWVCKEVVALTPIAVRFSSVAGSKNAVLYGVVPRIATLTQMSASAWVYLTSASTNYPIMTNREGSITGWSWFVLSNGKMYLRHFFTPTDGIWESTNDVFTALVNGWHHIAVTYNTSSAANDPVFYVDGVSVPVTEAATPAGTADLGINGQFMLGNMMIVGDVLAYNFKGLMKDARIYNRTLAAAEIAEIAAGENDYSTIPDGLIFQGLFVRSPRYSDYINNPILPSMKVLDQVFETVGAVTYDTTNSTYQVKGADPELTTYP